MDSHNPLPLAKPRPVLMMYLFAMVLTITVHLYHQQQELIGLSVSWYLSIVWTIPIGLSVMMFIGSVLARRDMVNDEKTHIPRCDSLVIVQIPTIGRYDVLPALTRSVKSFELNMPAHFSNWRLDIVAEETSEAQEEITALESPNVRVIFVPAAYETSNGTMRKARANCYVNELRIQEGEARHDVWVLHMDDDTGIGDDTAAEIACVIANNPFHRRAKHMAQGVLTYPRQFAVNRWTWLADAVRPSSDMSSFRFMTGSGTPLLGVHGELLLVRSSIEADIGWDFGKHLSITEDANFALLFSTQYPGGSTWIPARCYGASPATMKELSTQRKRWSRGLLHVATNPAVPFKRRLLLGYALSSWVLGPFQHIVVILLVVSLLGTYNTSPLVPWVQIAWAMNLAVSIWSYIEGLRHNAHASGMAAPKRAHWFALLLVPFFSFVEGWSGIKGAYEFVKDKIGRHKGELFEVISKPS